MILYYNLESVRICHYILSVMSTFPAKGINTLFSVYATSVKGNSPQAHTYALSSVTLLLQTFRVLSTYHYPQFNLSVLAKGTESINYHVQMKGDITHK